MIVPLTATWKVRKIFGLPGKKLRAAGKAGSARGSGESWAPLPFLSLSLLLGKQRTSEGEALPVS